MGSYERTAEEQIAKAEVLLWKSIITELFAIPNPTLWSPA